MRYHLYQHIYEQMMRDIWKMARFDEGQLEANRHSCALGGGVGVCL